MNIELLTRVIKLSFPYFDLCALIVSAAAAYFAKTSSLLSFIVIAFSQFVSLFVIFYVYMLVYWHVSGQPMTVGKIAPSTFAVSVFSAVAILGFARSKTQIGIGMSLLTIVLVSLFSFFMLLLITYLVSRGLLWFMNVFG